MSEPSRPLAPVRTIADRDVLAPEHLDVLIVDDDEDDFFIARALLGKATSIRCDATWVNSYDEGLKAVTQDRYDVALVDYRLGSRNGLELLREAIDRGTTTPLILLTGQGDLRVDLQAMAAGAADYLVKGALDAPLLERSIRYAVERRRADLRIREQATLLDEARDAIVAHGLDGDIRYWNKSAERLTGLSKEEALGRHVHDVLFDPDDQGFQKAVRAVRDEGEWSGELAMRGQGGPDVPVESRWTLVRDEAGRPQSILVINTDITERKRLEQQTLRSQRMESIGRLVGGIAHDLGNLLVPIGLGVKVMQGRFEDDARTMRTLEMIRKSAERGGDMVKQVLMFARGAEGERAPIDPVLIVQEVQALAEETFGQVEVEAEVEEGLPRVVGDATQLQQILMNLCVNARDALREAERTDGRVRILAGRVKLSSEDVRGVPAAEAGLYLRLAVQDNGPGIPPDVADKIFEPFFTTKPTGEGTGLGLSTVYNIAKSHGGFVDVQSQVGRGATFEVFLPVAREEAEERDAEDERGGTAASGEGARLLLVDDEVFIRETTTEILEQFDYEVVTADHGAKGLEHLVGGYVPDLVVTDLMMPELDGYGFIAAVRERGYEMPILAVSGMADGDHERALELGAERFLAKPYTSDQLLGAIQELLRQKA